MTERVKLNTPNLAICIKFYERLNQTIECIQSFLPSKLNIYILNNGSSKPSYKTLKQFCDEYKQITLFNSDRNLGCGPGRNYLITHTEEEWLVFADNDIIVKTPNWNEKFILYPSRHPDTEVFIPHIYNSHEKSYVNPISLEIKGKKIKYNSLIRGDARNTFPGGASFVNRKLFKRLGLFDENLFIGFSDFEFCVRGILSGNPVRVQIIPDIEFIHTHLPYTTELDWKAALNRYDLKNLEESYNWIVKKHGVFFPSDYKEWASIQRKQILAQRK